MTFRESVSEILLSILPFFIIHDSSRSSYAEALCLGSLVRVLRMKVLA